MRDSDVLYLRDAVDKIKDAQAETNIILARNTASLEEHMKRTAIQEDRSEKFEARLLPLEDTAKAIHFIIKAAVLVVGLAGGAKALGWL